RNWKINPMAQRLRWSIRARGTERGAASNSKPQANNLVIIQQIKNMEINLKNRNFLKLLDYTAEEIHYLLQLATKLKKSKSTGLEEQKLCGKNIALIFEKTSTRTRCAF